MQLIQCGEFCSCMNQSQEHYNQSRLEIETERIKYARDLENILLSFSVEIQKKISASSQLVNLLESLTVNYNNPELNRAIFSLKESSKQVNASSNTLYYKVHECLMNQYKRISSH